jgi:hypothetical protein
LDTSPAAMVGHSCSREPQDTAAAGSHRTQL